MTMCEVNDLGVRAESRGVGRDSHFRWVGRDDPSVSLSFRLSCKEKESCSRGREGTNRGSECLGAGSARAMEHEAGGEMRSELAQAFGFRKRNSSSACN